MNDAESMINQTGLAAILLQRRIAELEAENAALRAALEAAQWARWGASNGIHFCPVCHGLEPVHYSDCIVKAALSPKPGE